MYSATTAILGLHRLSPSPRLAYSLIVFLNQASEDDRSWDSNQWMLSSTSQIYPPCGPTPGAGAGDGDESRAVLRVFPGETQRVHAGQAVGELPACRASRTCRLSEQVVAGITSGRRCCWGVYGVPGSVGGGHAEDPAGEQNGRGRRKEDRAPGRWW